jgi:hypothetical protein
MDVQYPRLTVYDDVGNSDTYYDVIALTEGALTSETTIDIQVAGKRSVAAQAQTGMTVQLGDTLTVTGIIRNTGMSEVRNVEVLPTFMFFSDFPDSLIPAIIKPLVLTRVPKDSPPMAMRASLAPGDTIQVVRRFVFEKMAQYTMKSGDPYQDVPFRIKPSVVYAQGINTKGDTIYAEDPCHGLTPDQPVPCAEDYITLGPKVISGADEQPNMPGTFALHAAYPNPFNRTTTLTLDMPEAGNATVTVHDVMGQQVAILLDGRLQAGKHTVLFDAKNLVNGVYLVQARTDHGTQIQSVRLQP